MIITGVGCVPRHQITGARVPAVFGFFRMCAWWWAAAQALPSDPTYEYHAARPQKRIRFASHETQKTPIHAYLRYASVSRPLWSYD